MRSFLFSLLCMSFCYAGTAHAKPCSANDETQILKGLEKLSLDESKSEEVQAEAAFVRSELIHAEKYSCDVISGFAGNVYTIKTSTLKIHINFVTWDITNLVVERIAFN